MVSKYAVGVAALLQLSGSSVFLNQPNDLCSPAPSLASYIFVLAALIYFLDAEIYPRRFMHLPYFCKIVVESIVTLFLIEVSSILIWCSLERIIYRITLQVLMALGVISVPCPPSIWQSLILGAVTTSLSMSVLFYVLLATCGLFYLRYYTRFLLRTMRLYWQMLSCFWNMSEAGRRRAMNACTKERRCSARRRVNPKRNAMYNDYDDDDDDNEC